MTTPTSASTETSQVGTTDPGAAPQTTPLRHQLGLLIQWRFRRSLPVLPLFIIVQTLLSVSMVLGYGLIAGHPGREASLHLAGGGPAIALISLGLIMTPQWVSQSRTEGSLDWMRTLPRPQDRLPPGRPDDLDPSGAARAVDRHPRRQRPLRRRPRSAVVAWLPEPCWSP